MVNVSSIELPLCHQPFYAVLFPPSYTKKWILIAPPVLYKSRHIQQLHICKRASSAKKHCLLQPALELLGSHYSNMPVQSRGIHLIAYTLQIPKSSEMTYHRNLHTILLS